MLGLHARAAEDDAFEPRLELAEWDAPPRTQDLVARLLRAGRAPGGASLVRWTGFVADGEAEIGPDGLLRRVVIRDHHMARGRTAWRTVEIAFTGFPPRSRPCARAFLLADLHAFVTTSALKLNLRVRSCP